MRLPHLSLAAQRVATRLLFGASLVASHSACTTTDNSMVNQQVVFGPSLASPSVVTGGVGWSMRVQGRVFEPPESSRSRQAMIDALAPAVGANRNDPHFRSRADYFVADSVRNARISIKIGNRIVVLPETSDAAGCFSADIAIDSDEVASLAHDGIIDFESHPTRVQGSNFRGTALLLSTEGVTVVTDLDDTIKETNVNNHAEAKANLFVRPFKPVAGMPELYRAWQQADDANLHFHVVSAGPWQFHEPLRRFTESVGFPKFTWDMRCVDITDPAVLIDEIVKADPQRIFAFKVAKIGAFMKRYPKRHVVLVGDSGERDPEVYAAIVREFGELVDAVYIHNVSREGPGAKRYDALFRPLNALGKLQVFDQPGELPQRLGGVRNGAAISNH